MSFWKLSCERECDVLLKTDTWEDAWCLEYKRNDTNNERTLLYRYTMQCFVGLRWSSLHGEKCAKELLMADSDCLYWLGRALLFLLDCATDLCLLFVTKLDCWYPDTKEWSCPKELLLNRPTTPLTFFNITPVGGFEGRLRYLRTLNKVGFEKNPSFQACVIRDSHLILCTISL